MSVLSRVATLGLVSLALAACSPSDEPETSAADNNAAETSSASDASGHPLTDLPSGCENLRGVYEMLPQGNRVGDFALESTWCGGFHAVAEYINESDGYEFHVQVLNGESQLLADEMAAVGDGSEVIAGQMKDVITRNGEAFLEARDLCEKLSETDDSVAHVADSGICVMEEEDSIWTARKVHDDNLGLLVRFYAMSPGAADNARDAAEQLAPLFDEFSVTE